MQTLFALGVGFALGGFFYMYMYNKKNHKRRTFSRISGGGFRYTSRSVETGIGSDSIISQMEFLFKRDGKVVVEFIDNEEIHLTTLGTLKDELVDDKLDEMKKLIKENLSQDQINPHAEEVGGKNG